MSVKLTYRVRKPFKYAGIALKPGDEWQPNGSKNDTYIANSRMVAREETELVEEITNVSTTNPNVGDDPDRISDGEPEQLNRRRRK